MRQYRRLGTIRDTRYHARMSQELADLPPARPRLRIWPAALAVLCALAIAQFVAWQGRTSRDSIVAVTNERAYERTTLLHLERLLSRFKDIEAGSRGFLVTGDAAYLQPYEAARGEIPELLQTTKGRNPAMPTGMTWPELDELIGQRLALAARVVAERRRLGDQALDVEHLLDEGKRVMDRIREVFKRMEAAQGQRIVAMSEQVEATRQRASSISTVGSFVAFALTLAAAWLVLRERRQRIALELALREANRTLEARVAERTAALESARAQLSRFAAEQERAIEAERRRLSREVHDQIGQVFTALKLILASLPRTDFPPGQAEALDRALEMGIASTRRVTAVLRPPLLDDLGLGAALRHFAEDLGRAAGLAVTVDIADDEGLDEVARLGLFRIAQEAVTNVLRHAAAAKLEISGRRDGDAYLFCIADDGRGYDPATVRPGAIGIVGMRERAALLGAQCAIAAAPGDGVAITLRLPLRQNAGGKPTDESRNEHPAG